MVDLKELYSQGHRRFLFSDGVVREVDEQAYMGNGIPFDVNNGLPVYYDSDGRPNMGGKSFPHVVRVAEPSLTRDEDGQWWLEVPQSATIHDITKAWEVLNNG